MFLKVLILNMYIASYLYLYYFIFIFFSRKLSALQKVKQSYLALIYNEIKKYNIIL